MSEDRAEIVSDAKEADLSSSEKLDSLIFKAIDGPEAAPATEQKEAPASATERDEQGRFKAKAATESQETAPADPAPVAPVDSASTEPSQNAKPVEVTDGHFRGWSPEARTKFGTLPAEAQAFALDLSKQFQSQLTKASQEAAELRRSADPVLSELNKERDLFAPQGMTPIEAFKGYANIERTLTFGNFADKVKLIQDICHRYNVPYAQPQPVDPSDPMGGESYAAFHDQQAEIARTKAEAAQLKSQLDHFQRQTLLSQVDSFRSAQNADGTPKHPHFETVKAAMSHILAQGNAQSLEDAYSIAAKPIEDLIQSRALEARQQAERERSEAIDKARRAAPAKASPSMPAGKTAHKGLDAVIAGALDSMGV